MRKFFMALICGLFILSAQAQINGTLQISGQSVQLYAEPKTNAKVVTTLQAGQQIIPIFEQNNWIKIANPKTGDVGWISKDQFDKTTKPVPGVPIIRIFTTESTDKNQPEKVQAVQITTGGIAPIDQKQMQNMLNQLQKQQEQMQATFSKMLEQTIQMFNMDINKMIQVVPVENNNKDLNKGYGSPLIIIEQPKSNTNNTK